MEFMDSIDYLQIWKWGAMTENQEAQIRDVDGTHSSKKSPIWWNSFFIKPIIEPNFNYNKYFFIISQIVNIETSYVKILMY